MLLIFAFCDPSHSSVFLSSVACRAVALPLHRGAKGPWKCDRPPSLFRSTRAGAILNNCDQVLTGNREQCSSKLARAYSALDGEALMEISSKDTCLKECGDGITHSASPYRRESHEHDQSHSALSSGDCKGLFEEISGEEQTVLTVNEIEKDISALMNEENQLSGRNQPMTRM